MIDFRARLPKDEAAFVISGASIQRRISSGRHQPNQTRAGCRSRSRHRVSGATAAPMRCWMWPAAS